MLLINLLVWLVLAALAALTIWLLIRALRSRRWYIRWPGALISGLFTLLLAALLGLGAVGMYKLYVPAARPVRNIQVRAAPELVQRGQHLADAFCTSCHSPTGELPLIGGVDLAKDIPIPIGSFVSANLTPGGPLKNWTDDQIMNVLRDGVAPDGRRLLVMGSTYTRYLSDADMLALIAYLRSQPAVTNDTPQPPDQPNYLGVLITGAGMVSDLPPVEGSITAPAKAASLEYGKYILSYQDCRSCHGPDLLGGKNQLGPNGPGLRTVRGMTQAQFIGMMRTGTRPDGHQLQEPMPWKAIGRMDDLELSALYQYLVSIP
jgi:mono/diheme cytochrome c family protein